MSLVSPNRLCISLEQNPLTSGKREDNSKSMIQDDVAKAYIYHKANKIHTPDLCPGFQEKFMREGGFRFFNVWIFESCMRE